VLWNNVMAWRLVCQGLDRRVAPDGMLDAAAAICGLHAQLMSSAELSMWARVDGVRADTVARALWDERILVKTWAMRGTLHLLPASEYWTWQAGLSTYDHYLKGAWFRAFGVSRQQFDDLIEAITDSLEDRLLTREELAEEVAKRTGSAELGEKMRESWGALLKPAAFRGRLCFGPNEGQKVRFTHPQTWLGKPSEEVEPGLALDEVTRRFLRSNGPATREDYGRWWAISPAKALSRIRALGDEVAQVDVEGSPYWMLADQVAAAEEAEPPGRVNLLPAFDQYVIAATRHAEKMMPGAFKARIYRPQGWISPVLLVDGRMEGTWSYEKKAARLLVMVEPFVKLPKWATSAVDEEADKLAAFLGCEKHEVNLQPPG
jgi:uncharacterized protein YcaQ